MGTICRIPVKRRAEIFGRELRRDVIDRLRAIYDHAGEETFAQEATSLMVAIGGVLNHTCGVEQLAHALDVLEAAIDRVNNAAEDG